MIAYTNWIGNTDHSLQDIRHSENFYIAGWQDWTIKWNAFKEEAEDWDPPQNNLKELK